MNILSPCYTDTLNFLPYQQTLENYKKIMNKPTYGLKGAIDEIYINEPYSEYLRIDNKNNDTEIKELVKDYFNKKNIFDNEYSKKDKMRVNKAFDKDYSKRDKNIVEKFENLTDIGQTELDMRQGEELSNLVFKDNFDQKGVDEDKIRIDNLYEKVRDERIEFDKGFKDLLSKKALPENNPKDLISRIGKLTLSSNIDEQNKKISISDKSIKENITEFQLVFFNIINELINIDSYKNIPKIFYKDDRLFYIGIYLIILSIVLYIIGF